MAINLDELYKKVQDNKKEVNDTSSPSSLLDELYKKINNDKQETELTTSPPPALPYSRPRIQEDFENTSILEKYSDFSKEEEPEPIHQNENQEIPFPYDYNTPLPAHRDNEAVSFARSFFKRYEQGFSYGKDYDPFIDDEWIGFWGDVAETAGGISRWALITIPLSLATEGLSNAVPAYAKLASKAPAAGLALRDALTGLAASGIDQIIAPEGYKPGLEGTTMNAVMWGGGGLGRGVAGNLITKYLPEGNELTKKLITTSADIISSSIGAYPFVENKEDLFAETAVELIGFGLLDLLLYGHRMKGINLSGKGQVSLTKAQNALEDVLTTKSEVSKYKLIKNIDEVVKDIPAGKLDSLVKEYETNGSKDLIRRIEGKPAKDKNKKTIMSQPTKKETPSPSTTPDLITPSTKLDYDITVTDLAKFVEESTGNLSKERLEELATVIKPSRGDAINTTRIDIEGQARELSLQIAEKVKNRDQISLEEIRSKATELTEENLKQIKTYGELYSIGEKDLNEIRDFFKRAPEKLNQIRGIQASLAIEATEAAKVITSENATNVDRARFILAYRRLNDVTEGLLESMTGAGRTLSSLRDVVDGKAVDFMTASKEIFENNPLAVQEIDSIVNDFGGEKATLKLAKELLKQKDLDGITRSARKIKAHPFGDAILNYFQSSILSSPDTQAVNLVAQTANAIYDNSINLISSVTTGPIEYMRTGDWMSPGEAFMRLKGDLYGTLYKSYISPLIPLTGPGGSTSFVKAPSKLGFMLNLLRPTNWEQAIEKSSLGATKSSIEFTSNSLSTKGFKGTNTHQFLENVSRKLDGRPLEEVPIAQLLGATLNEVGAILKLPFMGLNLGDKFFSTGGYYSELFGETYRESRNKSGQVLKGIERKTRQQHLIKGVEQYRREQQFLANYHLEDNIKNTLTEWRKKYTPEDLKLIQKIDEKSLWYANHRTFKNPAIGKRKDLERFISEARLAGLPVGRLAVPLLHTQSELLAIASRASIAAPVYSSVVREDLKAGGARRQKTLAGMLVGTYLATLGMYLAKERIITPSYSNPSERETGLNAGIQEHSVLYKGKYYEINRLQPLSIPFTMGADYYKAFEDATSNEEAMEIFSDYTLFIMSWLDEEYLGKHLSSTGMTLYKGLKEQPLFAGADELTDSLAYGDLTGYLAGMGESFKPFSNFRRWAKRQETILGVDNPNYQPTYMEYKGVFKEEKDKYPKRDAYGKPISVVNRMYGLKVSEQTISPIRREVVELNLKAPETRLYLTPPNEVIRFYNTKIELNAEQLDKLKASMDEMFRVEDVLNTVVANPEYKRLPDKTKISLIKKVYNDIKQQAEYYIVSTTPELIKQIPESSLEQWKKDIQVSEDKEIIKWYK